MAERVAFIESMSELMRRFVNRVPASRSFKFSPASFRPVVGVLLIVLTVFVTPLAHSLEDYVSPLAPPDTSSPRGTLKSFRDNMELAFRDFYEERYTPLPYAQAAEKRALACLDTSELPPIRANRIAIEAALLLDDVLGRVT